MKRLYDTYVLPRIVDHLCGDKHITAQRQLVVPNATGVVLELGVGSGLNLALYDKTKVKKLIGIDPHEPMCALAKQRIETAPVRPEMMIESAEAMPFDDKMFDTVVITYTLCSIPDVTKALGEVRRVMKPAARVLFCEHARAPDANIMRWQDRLNGLWGTLAGGCHINRDMPKLFEEGGFKFDKLERYYLKPFPRIVGFHTRGVARAA